MLNSSPFIVLKTVGTVLQIIHDLKHFGLTSVKVATRKSLPAPPGAGKSSFKGKTIFIDLPSMSPKVQTMIRQLQGEGAVNVLSLRWLIFFRLYLHSSTLLLAWRKVPTNPAAP